MADAITALKYCMTGVCTLASIENLLSIAVFAGTRKLWVKYYTFVANLALADLIFALLIIPHPWLPYSLVFEGFITGAYTVSVVTILAVAINRYLALSLVPLARYDSRVTGQRLIGVCVIIWSLSLVYGVVIYAAGFTKYVFYVVHFIVYPLAGCFVWFITALLYYLAFRKIKQYTPPLASTTGISAEEERDQTRVKQTRRLLVMFVLILVTSFISWAPTSALRVVAILNPSLGQDKTFQTYMWVTYLLYTFSTVINPWIYWWRLDGFREGFHAMFCRCATKIESNQIEVDLATNENTLLDEADL